MEIENLPDGVSFDRAFFEEMLADDLTRRLHGEIAWTQGTILLYGKTHAMPRLVAWHGDEGLIYTYSRIQNIARPWTSALSFVRSALEARIGTRFNGVLCNLYRDERDSMSWHADDELELGPEPTIASLSFGAARTMQFRSKFNPRETRAIRLCHGSLLLMMGTSQREWQHRIPKSHANVGERINLTFRTIH